jgi:hypothetical protein
MNTDPRNRTTAELKLTFDNMLQTLDSLKENIALHEQILTERYHAQMMMEMDQKTRNSRGHAYLSGEHTSVQDGVKLTLIMKPKIKWDNLKLRDVAGSMDPDMVYQIFKIEFSVPERTFKALTDKKLIEQLTEARTVTYPEPKVTFA